MNNSERFAQIFRGRTEAYGTWNGGAIHYVVSPALYDDHLNTPNEGVGIYPHLGIDGVTWGCIDIDGGDFPKEDARSNDQYDRKQPEWHDWTAMERLAHNLVKALRLKNVPSVIEKTRNGFHVWVFPQDETVPAKTMRRALMAACKVCKYDPNEVNPKQEVLAEGKIGNYVRLPYNHGFAERKERYFLDPSTHQPVLNIEKALWIAENYQTTTKALEAIAQMWTPPKSKMTVDVSVPADSAVAKLRGLARTIWDEGPLPGSDRSSTLAHLAHLCREDNLTLNEAFSVICSADRRWGKFQPEGREDAVEQLTAITERAYAS